MVTLVQLAVGVPYTVRSFIIYDNDATGWDMFKVCVGVCVRVGDCVSVGVCVRVGVSVRFRAVVRVGVRVQKNSGLGL